MCLIDNMKCLVYCRENLPDRAGPEEAGVRPPRLYIQSYTFGGR